MSSRNTKGRKARGTSGAASESTQVTVSAIAQDFAKLEALIELMRRNQVNEVRLGDASGDVAVSFGAGTAGPATVHLPAVQNAIHAGFGAQFAPAGYMPGAGAPMMPVPQQQNAVAAPVAAAAEPAAKAAGARTLSGKERMIRSPFVGTFYRSPSPGAEAFVQVGQRVRKGETLCIVEAMKLMNEIEAESDGVIKDILAENESPVEFEQPLFVIE